MEDIIKLLNDIYAALVPITAMLTICFMFILGYVSYKFIDSYKLVKRNKVSKDE